MKALSARQAFLWFIIIYCRLESYSSVIHCATASTDMFEVKIREKCFSAGVYFCSSRGRFEECWQVKFYLNLIGWITSFAVIRTQWNTGAWCSWHGLKEAHRCKICNEVCFMNCWRRKNVLLESVNDVTLKTRTFSSCLLKIFWNVLTRRLIKKKKAILSLTGKCHISKTIKELCSMWEYNLLKRLEIMCCIEQHWKRLRLWERKPGFLTETAHL